MSMALFYRLSTACLLLVSLTSFVIGSSTSGESDKCLPGKVGDFRSLSGVRSLDELVATGAVKYEIETVISRTYGSARGERFTATLFRARTERGAYSIFSQWIQNTSSEPVKIDDVGSIAYAAPNGILIYKGTAFVSLSDDSVSKNSEKLMTLATILAGPLDKSEGEIPVLIKHLPDWEVNERRAVYAISSGALQDAAGNQPVLEAVSFSGGAEAVTAPYGTS